MPDSYSEQCQTSKINIFAEVVNNFQPSTIFAKSSILNAWHGFEFNSVLLPIYYRFQTQCLKIVQMRSFFWSVSLCIQSQYRKIRTKKTPSLDTFRAVTVYGEIMIKQLTLILTPYKKWSFPPRISSVNVTKSVVSCRFHFCQIYFKGALSLCCMKGSNALCLGLIQMRSKSNYFV